MSQQLLIQNGNTVYEPVVQDEITWTTERKGAAGKLEFKVVKDEIINFEEGNPVAFKVDNTNLFYGFVFRKKRDKEQIILNEIGKNLNFCDTILMKVFRNYTIRIYRIGVNDAFYWDNKKYGKNSKNKKR